LVDLHDIQRLCAALLGDEAAIETVLADPRLGEAIYLLPDDLTRALAALSDAEVESVSSDWSLSLRADRGVLASSLRDMRDLARIGIARGASVFLTGQRGCGETSLDDWEANGRRRAKEAILEGRPRLIVEEREDRETTIDRFTGLPMLVMRTNGLGPDGRRLAASNAAYNAEILRAKEAGDIRLDLRPFLTTRRAVDALFRTGRVHVLAHNRPLDLDRLGVRYEVVAPAPELPQSREADVVVRRVDACGGDRLFFDHGSPIRVAVGVNEETLVFENGSVREVYHTRTGTHLHRFPERGSIGDVVRGSILDVVRAWMYRPTRRPKE
jgi:hypothetical protein